MATRQTKVEALRSQSVFDPPRPTDPNFQPPAVQCLTRHESHDPSLRASPSLRYVIKPNMVQARKERFEKLKQDDCLKVSDGNNSRGQVKSDSYYEISSSQVPMLQSKRELRRSCADDGRSTSEIKLTMDTGSSWLRLPMQTDLSSQRPTEQSTDAGDNINTQMNKPPLRPKPLLGKNVNADISPSKAAESEPRYDDLELSVSPGGNEVFCLRDSNNNSHVSEVRGQESVSAKSKQPVLHSRSNSQSPPAPPPKPPRILHEVYPGSNEKNCVNTEGDKYDRLTNAVSVVIPAVLPAVELPNEPSNVNIDFKVNHEYEKISDVVPQHSEVKKQKSAEKKEHKFALKFPKPSKRKKDKTLQIDNPSYGFITEADDVIKGNNAVKRLSNNSVESESPSHHHRHSASSTKEQIYDVPCDVRTSRVIKSDSFDPESNISFDGDGYAIPDVEKSSVIKLAQSKVKSKVSHAYAFLRLPNETGDSTQIDDAAEEEIIDQEKRLCHVKNVSKCTAEAIANYEKVKLKTRIQLFEYGMIIGLEANEAEGFKPKVLKCVPAEKLETDSFVCNFCFPDADVWKPLSSYKSELFSFVLTSEIGERKYGWCRRYLPPGTEPRLAEALCIISSVGEFGMYEQLLRNLEEFRSHSMECAVDLFEIAYARPMPLPNKEVYIRTEVPGQGRLNITLKRASEFNLCAMPFSDVLKHLPIPVLIQVFGAILLERKIVFCAGSLSTLSSCVRALVALLYPFEWQHTYVTVLPVSLIDIVDAPIPFIVGILTSLKPYLDDHDLVEVLVVDLDTGSISKGVGDESHIIPKKIVRALTAALSDDTDVQSGGTLTKESSIRDETVREAFLRLFIETCAHYTDFILRPENDEYTFQRDLFVKEVHSRSIRMFLEWFTQTQMFEVFMSGKLLGNPTSSENFDQQITEYREEMEANAKPHSGRKKKFSKKITEFFRESGDKIKRTFHKKVYV